MRKDVTEDRAVVAEILQKAEYVTLALVDDGGPYSVPVSHAFEGGVLYFHSSKTGRKAEALRMAVGQDGQGGHGQGGRVAFSAAIELKPKTGPLACDWGCTFRSVLGSGVPRFIQDEGEKKAALNALMRKYAGRDDLPYDDGVLARTAVIAVDVDRATARLKLT